MYARIKGVKESELDGVVATKLAEFDLVQFANKKAGTLSGGNKRKLSVAIATVGNPQIIFLDEPSTGVDPVSRRFMWQVINRIATQQKLCSIILTTHSMEEVQALSQRVGIMVSGHGHTSRLYPCSAMNLSSFTACVVSAPLKSPSVLPT